MESTFSIKSFQSGINEYLAEALLKPYEATKCSNANISSGSLKTFYEPSTWHTEGDTIHSVVPFYDFTTKHLMLGVGTKFKEKGGSDLHTISGKPLDFLNFQDGDKRILICCSSDDTPFMYKEGAVKKLLNRRKKFNEEGEHSGYIDAEGEEHEDESTITTYAPKGDFVELHYDRLWIAGDKENPDRIYFSTANVYGADIQDFTVPMAEEEEINMHGGFLDVRSYDGSKIIGMKVIFNSVVIFKNKSAYKIFGNSPSNYQMVELFNCNGAIADKTICVGNNGAFFLNSDGIYYYDGTNTTLVSQKISSVIKRMNLNYASQSVAIYNDNKYYVAIPVDGSEKNNLLIEFDVNLKSFTTYNVGDINTFQEYEDMLLYSSDKDIKRMFDGTTSLPLMWETPMFDFGKQNARKMSNYIYFRAKGQGKVKFELETDRKVKTLEVELTNNETFYRKKLKNKGRMFKLRIMNVNNSSFELISPELFVEVDED